MRTKNITIECYAYDELNQEAKERVKERYYLEIERDANIFYQSIVERLEEDFPRSNLDVTFSLGYCQGDGLNIFGAFNLIDFLPFWEEEEAIREKMSVYLHQSTQTIYEFEKNHRYSYSCKFIDRKNSRDAVSSIIEDLECSEIEDIDEGMVAVFFRDLINYFETLDKELEREGYQYFYEATDEEVREWAIVNCYEFDENGILLN